MPLSISVLIPCYNAERYVGEALASVLNQTLAPAEIVVVDDGSSDQSVDVVRRMVPAARLVRQPNGGIARARNHALQLASGSALAFLDADDVWPPDSLARRAAVLDADPDLDGAAGLVEQFVSPELPDETRQRLAVPTGPLAARVAGAMLLRREAIERVGSFDEQLRVGETVDWVARADAKGLRFGTIDHVVLRRRVHETNTGRQVTQDRSDYLRVLKASIDRRRAGPGAIT